MRVLDRLVALGRVARITNLSRRTKTTLFLVCLAFSAAVPGIQSTAHAQRMPSGSESEEYVRLLELVGHVDTCFHSVRPIEWKPGCGRATGYGPWKSEFTRHGPGSGRAAREISVFQPRTAAYWNSQRVWGMNDGAVWQGRGATLGISTGIFGRFGILSAALRPMLLFNQNAAVEIEEVSRAGRSAYVYAGSSIDWPQRYGDRSFWTLDGGDTYVRIDWRGFAAGLSNERLWWGPGTRTSAIMSNNAPGFPHVFAGTSGAIDVGIGKLQLQVIGAFLRESEFFDEDPDNDRRYLSGLVFDVEPDAVEGLSVGIARTYVMHAHGLDFGDYLSVLESPFKKSVATEDVLDGTDQKDQQLSVFGRWNFSDSGFEIYGEWARGDHSWDVRDLMIEPEHGSAAMFGLQKALGDSRRPLKLTVELTKMEAPRTTRVRSYDAGFFYTHGKVVQGYTQHGQVIGAGIGPGSNEQFIGLDRFAPWGRAGAFVFRTVYDEDRLYREGHPADEREVEFSGGVRGLVFLEHVELEGTMTYSYLMNRFYERENNVGNLNVAFSARWRIAELR